MKKLYYCFLLFGLNGFVFGQPLSASNNADFSAWSVFDADMDSYNWGIYNISTWGTAIDSQGECAISFSYGDPSQNPNFTNLSPDNWIISPVIDLTNYSNTYLNFSIGALDNINYAEHYGVYVSTDIATIQSATPLFEETMSVGETMNFRSVDLSGFDGASTVYVAFRHFNVTGESALVLDDILVDGVNTTGLISETYTVSIYPNPVLVSMHIQSDLPLKAVSVYDLYGKLILREIVSGNSECTLNLNEFMSGTYICELQSNDGIVIRKLLQKSDNPN